MMKIRWISKSIRNLQKKAAYIPLFPLQRWFLYPSFIERFLGRLLIELQLKMEKTLHGIQTP